MYWACVHLAVCVFANSHPFNPCIIRNVLCVVSGRVESLCDVELVFSSRETEQAEIHLSSLNHNLLLSFAALIISVASDQKLLGVFCCTERLLNSS